jgi:hypothetical protein
MQTATSNPTQTPRFQSPPKIDLSTRAGIEAAMAIAVDARDYPLFQKLKAMYQRTASPSSAKRPTNRAAARRDLAALRETLRKMSAELGSGRRPVTGWVRLRPTDPDFDFGWPWRRVS